LAEKGHCTSAKTRTVTSAASGPRRGLVLASGMHTGALSENVAFGAGGFGGRRVTGGGGGARVGAGLGAAPSTLFSASGGSGGAGS
jgi:hypothetical protein